MKPTRVWMLASTSPVSSHMMDVATWYAFSATLLLHGVRVREQSVNNTA